jgi:hypothetical protein
MPSIVEFQQFFGFVCTFIILCKISPDPLSHFNLLSFQPGDQYRDTLLSAMTAMPGEEVDANGFMVNHRSSGEQVASMS